MKRDITQEELGIIEDYYNEDFISIYRSFLNSINNSRFTLIYYNSYMDIDELTGERSKIYREGIIEDTNSENIDENLDFSIKIIHRYLNGNTLIECYKFAVEHGYDLRIFNGGENIIIYFKKIEDKEKRIKNVYSKQYFLGRYSLIKTGIEIPYYPKDVKLYFENLIETINYHFFALLIKNHFNQYPINDLIEECKNEYEQNMCPFGESILDKMDRYYLQRSSIFNYLQPIIDAERGCHWRYKYNIDNDFYYIPKESTDEDCYDVDRTEKSQIEDFIVSYIENNGRIKGNRYKDSYKKMLLHPLPFQMIDYNFLSQRESVNEVVYIYRLSAFADSYLLHKIFSLYNAIRSYTDLNVKFVVKSLYNTKNRESDSLLKTTKCNNPYLCTLFRLLPYTDGFSGEIPIIEYGYNDEYINFFFYIIESKNKKTLDSDSYFEEVEELKRQEELDRKARDREE